MKYTKVWPQVNTWGDSRTYHMPKSDYCKVEDCRWHYLVEWEEGYEYGHYEGDLNAREVQQHIADHKVVDEDLEECNEHPGDMLV